MRSGTLTVTRNKQLRRIRNEKMLTLENKKSEMINNSASLNSIGGMALTIGEAYQWSRVEVRRTDRNKKAIITALVFWYLFIVTFAVPALYYFTFQQVSLTTSYDVFSSHFSSSCSFSFSSSSPFSISSSSSFPFSISSSSSSSSSSSFSSSISSSTFSSSSSSSSSSFTVLCSSTSNIYSSFSSKKSLGKSGLSSWLRRC